MFPCGVSPTRGRRGKQLIYFGDIRDGAAEYQGDNCVLMQSTGLLDLKGKEIFEGDVVHIDGRPNDSWVCDGVVVWDDGSWRCKIDNKTLHHYVYAWKWAITVTGNIFENPELIRDQYA